LTREDPVREGRNESTVRGIHPVKSKQQKKQQRETGEENETCLDSKNPTHLHRMTRIKLEKIVAPDKDSTYST
jgi:hypothetical protein